MIKNENPRYPKRLVPIVENPTALVAFLGIPKETTVVYEEIPEKPGFYHPAEKAFRQIVPPVPFEDFVRSPFEWIPEYFEPEVKNGKPVVNEEEQNIRTLKLGDVVFLIEFTEEGVVRRDVQLTESNFEIILDIMNSEAEEDCLVFLDKDSRDEFFENIGMLSIRDVESILSELYPEPEHEKEVNLIMSKIRVKLYAESKG